MKFIAWFFATPTPIIALVSAIIAFYNYSFQKKEKKKSKAHEIASTYAKYLMPRQRFISDTLKSIDEIDIFLKMFEGKMVRFDNFELTQLLKDDLVLGISNYEKFENCIEKIDMQKFKLSIFKSEGTINNFFANNIIEELSKSSKNNLCPLIFKRILYDFLNELESLCVLLRYNIADEKIIYQALHLTFLNNIKYWYYFIAKDNYLNGDRYYDNLIWLYSKWNERKNKQIKKGNTISITYRGKRL